MQYPKSEYRRENVAEREEALATKERLRVVETELTAALERVRVVEEALQLLLRCAVLNGLPS